MKPVNFFAMSDVVVVGTNSENADMTNPRGEQYGFAAYVIGESYEGERRRLHVATDVCCEVALSKAEKMASALNMRLRNFGKPPVAFDRWPEYFPAYGSTAYDEEELIEWERRMDEEQDW